MVGAARAAPAQNQCEQSLPPCPRRPSTTPMFEWNGLRDSHGSCLRSYDARRLSLIALPLSSRDRTRKREVRARLDSTRRSRRLARWVGGSFGINPLTNGKRIACMNLGVAVPEAKAGHAICTIGGNVGERRRPSAARGNRRTKKPRQGRARFRDRRERPRQSDQRAPCALKVATAMNPALRFLYSQA